MIKRKRADIGLMMTVKAIHGVSSINGLTLLEPPIETVTLYHYVNVKHWRLIPSLEKALIKLNDSGRALKILGLYQIITPKSL